MNTKELTLEGFVARDKFDDIFLFTYKPKRFYPNGEELELKWGEFVFLPEESFPEITFESKPKMVKVNITLINE